MLYNILRTRVLVITLLSIISISANAQISYSNGRLIYGKADPHPFLPITITGGGTYWTIDNKFFQLDLSPENPRLAGTGEKIYFYNTATNKYNTIYAADMINTSDARAKKNIKSFGNGLDNILKLRPVTYKWKKDGDADAIVDGKNFAIGPTNDMNDQYGFLAQEVEEILPEVVETSEEGDKGINYIAFIPMLVEAVQELQSKFDEQAVQIEQLENQMPSALLKKIKNCKIQKCTVDDEGYLDIDYTLTSNAKDSYIVVKSILGREEKKIEISKYADNCNENISDLKSGLHTVTLVVDGLLCDTKLFTWSKK